MPKSATPISGPTREHDGPLFLVSHDEPEAGREEHQDAKDAGLAMALVGYGVLMIIIGACIGKLIWS